MKRFDVCNGDADGLCALVQWRLHDPADADVISGLKRDIELVHKAKARAGDEVNVFDLSLRRNRSAVLQLLDAGARVRYFDHHDPGELLVHPLLQAHIDTSDSICTSLIVNGLLDGEHARWAIVGAYGDNLAAQADDLAQSTGFDIQARACLRDLGEAINHNAYGVDATDVLIAPDDLFSLLVRHADPLLAWKLEPTLQALVQRCRADMTLALACTPCWQSSKGVVYRLPSAAWAYRASGTLANTLAQREPDRAHAVLVPRSDGAYAVSVRSPLSFPGGAHDLCMRYGGAGRARAAGIDALREDQIAAFIDAFSRATWEVQPSLA